MAKRKLLHIARCDCDVCIGRPAGTIGELERLAGITDRAAFWCAVADANPGRSAGEELDLGVAELRHRILDAHHAAAEAA